MELAEERGVALARLSFEYVDTDGSRTRQITRIAALAMPLPMTCSPTASRRRPGRGRKRGVLVSVDVRLPRVELMPGYNAFAEHR